MPEGEIDLAEIGNLSVDYLSCITLREHVSLDALMQANGIANPDLIQAGQVLRIPAAAPTP